MDFAAIFDQGLRYEAFLSKYGTDEQRRRWEGVYTSAALTADQNRLLVSFVREMKVLVVAGTWCGDCVNQCPMFAHFAAATPTIDLRFLDRDEHADAQQALQICGGNRVPVLVFFAEDGAEVARYGDRTLSKYRQMMIDQTGPTCPTGINIGKDPLVGQVLQDWLDQFERAQWILRLSARLRKLHND